MWPFSYSKRKMSSYKNLIHAKEVYKQGFTGDGIGVALLDTGVYNHPDIGNQVIYFKDFVYQKALPYDNNGHGTHVAGIICGDGTKSNGKIKGMAPKCNLIALKVLDANGDGETDHVVEALDWIWQYHKEYDIRIINFSMGFHPHTENKKQEQIVNKLEELWKEGIAVVTAAGNGGPLRQTIATPGISKILITVGAVSGGLGHYKMESYSGRGPTLEGVLKPEILAPGSKIISLATYGHGYTSKSGTSMSVPIVTGALALALEANPNLKAEELKRILFSTVVRVPDFKEECWGVLHVDRLVQKALDISKKA